MTGDNPVTANAIADKAGIDDVHASLLPEDKERIMREYMKKGTVAMVGDGINDAPALATAHVGMAIGAGTDIAIDAADVVLMKSRLTDVPAAIRLSRKTLKNMYSSFTCCWVYVGVGPPYLRFSQCPADITFVYTTSLVKRNASAFASPFSALMMISIPAPL